MFMLYCNAVLCRLTAVCHKCGFPDVIAKYVSDAVRCVIANVFSCNARARACARACVCVCVPARACWPPRWCILRADCTLDRAEGRFRTFRQTPGTTRECPSSLAA